MKSPVLLLRREEVVLPVPVSADLADAVSDTTIEFAERELGYLPPSEKARRARIAEAKKKLERPLGKALIEAGIKPFTHESVNRYKVRMARSFILSKKRLSDGFGVFLFVSGMVAALIVWMYFGGLIGVLGFLVSLVSLSLGCKFDKSIKEKRFSPVFRKCFIAIWNAAIIATGIIFVVVADGLTGPPKKLWRKVRLKGYEGDIPRFALETAQEVKMRCSGVEFFVEELVDNEARKDPFLVAEHGEEGHREQVYIEIWAEPGFEQKRIA